jgi:hypothetical protein
MWQLWGYEMCDKFSLGQSERTLVKIGQGNNIKINTFIKQVTRERTVSMWISMEQIYVILRTYIGILCYLKYGKFSLSEPSRHFGGT